MKTSLKARVTFFVLFCFFVFSFLFRVDHILQRAKVSKMEKKNEISSLKGKRDTQMQNNLKSEKKKE